MKQINSVKVRAGEGFLDRESEKFIYNLNLLGSHFTAVIVLSGSKDLGQRLEVDQVLTLKHVQLGIELQDFLL